MNVLDWILVAIRWGHALAAVAWVGGGIFYLLVLRPGLRQAQVSRQVNQAIGAEFRGLVNTAIGVLLLTGILLSVSRLTSDTVTVPYVVVLAIKIALSLYMFYIVRFLRQPAYPEETNSGSGWLAVVRSRLTSTPAILITGIIVFGLADVLDMLFEKGLGG